MRKFEIEKGEQSNSKVFDRIRQILESAKSSASRSVNSAQVIAYWLIGKEIVEEEQQGKKRAGYGQALLKGIAEKLSVDYGKGFSVQNLKFIRQFYLEFPKLIDPKRNGYAVSSQSADSWIPGQLKPDLSWTHYRTLLRVSKAEARTFYEIEAIKKDCFLSTQFGAARQRPRGVCTTLALLILSLYT